MIYLDHAATTRPHEEVRTAVGSYQEEGFYNPSAQYADNASGLKTAREQVANSIGTSPGSIIFTAGGSEADNTALKWIVSQRERGHIVTSTIEHDAIEESCQWIERHDGFEVTRVSPTANGRVDPTDVAEAIRSDTEIVSIMHANNETGVLQPLGEIAAIANERDVLVHSDTVQAAGKIPIDVDELGLDMASFSAHKFYGPKGVGALYVREELQPELEPLLHGGGQEYGLRSGTENVPGIVGMGIAAERAQEDMTERAQQLTALRDEFVKQVRERTNGELIGHPEQRLPGYALFCFPEKDGTQLVERLVENGIAVSSGSACHSGVTSPSRVLTEMGVDVELALGAVRFSMGRHTSREELQRTVETLTDIL